MDVAKLAVDRQNIVVSLSHSALSSDTTRWCNAARRAGPSASSETCLSDG